MRLTLTQAGKALYLFLALAATSFIPRSTVYGATEESPVLYLPLASDAKDNSGNGYSVEQSGGSFTNSSFLVDDNTTDYLSVSTTPVYNLGDFTFEATLRINKIHTGVAEAENCWFSLMSDVYSNELDVSYSGVDGGWNVTIQDSTYFFEDNRMEDTDWHLVRIKRQNDQMTLCIDHENVNSYYVGANLLLPTDGGFIIGQNQGSTAGGDFNAIQNFAGEIRDFKVYHSYVEDIECALSDALAYFSLDADLYDAVSEKYGSITGTVTAVTDRLETAKGASSFDGKSMVEFGLSHNLMAKGEFSLSAWVYPTSLDGQQVLLAEWDYGVKKYALGLNGSKVEFKYTGGTIVSDEILSLNTWQMITLCYDGNETYIYLNKSLVFSDYGSLDMDETFGDGLSIGSMNSDYYYSGYLDDIYIMDHMLEATDVEALYFYNGYTPSYAIDLEISNISYPTLGCGLGNSETVTFEVLNNGTKEVSGANFTLYLDDEKINSMDVSSALPVGSSTLSFTSTTDFSSYSGSHALSLTATVDGDEDSSNDSYSTSMHFGSATESTNGWEYYTVCQGIEGSTIYDLKMVDTTVWVLSDKGLFTKVPGSDFVAVSGLEGMKSMATDGSGNFVFNGGGIFMFMDSDMNITSDASLSDYSFEACAIQYAGLYYFGSGNGDGLAVYDGNNIFHFKDKFGKIIYDFDSYEELFIASESGVLSVYDTLINQEVWVGQTKTLSFNWFDYNLYFYSEGKYYKYYSQTLEAVDGLEDIGEIYQSTGNSNSMWVVGQKGFAKYTNDEIPYWEIYGLNEGGPTAEVSCISTSDYIEEVWMGTTEGDVVVKYPTHYVSFYPSITDLSVTFTNYSYSTTGASLKYTWDFGDGSYAEDSDPSHTYKEAGKYEVCLTVTDENSNMQSYCTTVIVTSTETLCMANFEVWDGGDGLLGLTNASLGSIEYNWYFGDGGTSTLAAPVYTYDQTGSYKVTLAIYDETTGCMDKLTQEVDIFIDSTSSQCYANFSVVMDSSTVSFKNNSKVDNGEYYWSFGDGNYAKEKSPSYTYEEDGKYEVTLVIHNTKTGCMDKVTKVVPINAASDCETSYKYFTKGLDVAFQGDTLGVSNRCFWDFGDGNYSYNMETSHSYEKAGYYTVALTVKDDDSGCLATYKEEIYVEESTSDICKAAFVSFTEDYTTSFSNKSSGDNLVYVWDFGDGDYSKLESPNHTYSATGKYEVTLLVANTTTRCVSKYREVVMIGSTKNYTCEADFKYYTDETSVYFTDNSKGNISHYLWDFGDGNYSTSARTSHTYAEAGYYRVRHYIYNSNTKCMDEVSKAVVVMESNTEICQADFAHYNKNNTVLFKAQPIGQYAQYFWDFDDGTNSNQMNPLHTFPEPGYYEVAFTVTDTVTKSFDTEIKRIYVEGGATTKSTQEPVNADFVSSANPNSLTVNFGNQSKGKINYYYWDFGDKSDPAASKNPSYTYNEAGYYKTCLTVYNSKYQNTKCKYIAVGDVSSDQTAYFTYYADSVYANAYFKNASLGDIVEYHWDFGDGVYSYEENPSHTYADTGYYAVCLTTVSTGGNVEIFCDDVRIGNAIADPCLFGCVWPGDANNDLEANHYDLLTIGLNYGMRGCRRENATEVWYGQFCQNWANYQFDGTNNMHGDCNGDGLINFQDTVSIAQNFAYSHYDQSLKKDAATWSIALEETNIAVKKASSTRTVRGILSRPVEKTTESIYGLGFEIKLANTDGLVWEELQVRFDGNFLGTDGDDVISFYSIDEVKGIIYISLCKTDQENVEDDGAVVEIDLPYEEGYGDEVTLTVSSEQGGILASGEGVNITGSTTTLVAGIEDWESNSNPVRLYPNPNQGKFTVEIASTASDLVLIEILDLKGKQVYLQSYPSASTNFKQSIETESLQEGIYLVRSQVNGINYYHKLVIQ